MLLAGPACRRETRDVDVAVVDDEGAPIKGALVYVEAFEINKGAFDFVWAWTDPLGRPLTAEGFKPTIDWSSSAHIACAAFYPGARPAVYIQHAGEDYPGQVSLLLQDSTEAALDFQPALAKLSFPFEARPDLADRLREAVNRPLLEAFRTSYETLTNSGMPMTDGERNKAAFLHDLFQAD